MARKKKHVLEAEPFPQLEWDDYFWSATITMDAWKGFQSRSGTYASRNGKKKSNGVVRLSVSVLDDEEKTTPLPEQAAAFRDLIGRQTAIRDSMLESILHEYPEYRSQYLDDYDLDETDDVLPLIDRPEQLKEVIGLSSILIHTVSWEGIAYVGY